MLSRVNRVRLSGTQRTEAHQAPLSVGFSRQAYWSALPFPPPGDPPGPGAELVSLASPALAGGFFAASATWAWELSGGQSCLLRAWLRTGRDATRGDAGEGGAAGGPAQASRGLVPFEGPFRALPWLDILL